MFFLAAGAAILLAGCNLGYLARGAYEEARILWNRQPIDRVIANPELSPEVRARLQTVLAAREFARDQLGLKVGGAYTTVTKVDKGAVIYVVLAALGPVGSTP